MKSWANLFRVIILITGIFLLSFNAQLYDFCKRQKIELDAMKDQQKMEAQVNSNKFKYQQDQIERLNKDLEASNGRIKDQQDAITAQKDAGRDIQTSLIDIKAEADAIKQDMKSWQKDYVSVLAELEKKIDGSKEETKILESNLDALNIPGLKENINSLKADIEKMNYPPDNNMPHALPAPEKKIERTHLESR